ncbi:MAG TPA: DNA repair protein RecO [Chitinophagales bacterium]|nr:DNA repair protein RecO [Chitinophagales bacterium]
MYHKTRGIVLHTIKYSETSVIAKIYTEKLGLQSYIVKGVRAAKSKSKAAMLQPLTLLEMEVSHRENKGLQYIKEFTRSFIYQSIPFDTLKSTISFFLLEVITKAIREHEPNEEMFEFIYESFCALDKEEKLNPDFHLVFLIQLSRYLGFAPHGNYSDYDCFFEMSEGVFIAEQSTLNMMNQAESRLLSDLMQENLFANNNLKITRAERKQMMRNLLTYYQLHLENFSLKSPEILEEILD